MSEKQQISNSALGEDPFEDLGLDWLESETPDAPSERQGKDTEAQGAGDREPDPSPPSQEDEQSLPPWLADDFYTVMDASDAPPEEEIAANAAEADLPFWLVEEDGDDGPGPQDPPQEREVEVQEIPDDRAQVSDPPPGSPLAEEPSDFDLPPWLGADEMDTPEGPETITAEADEDAGLLLEELIAAIDEQIDETFGTDLMTGLAHEAQEEQSGEVQHVIFQLVDTKYAVPITSVSEVGQPLDITRVPNVPEWVRGVANLRGDVISVVDLRTFLGLEPAAYGESNRMMVAHAQEEDMTTALLVDRVSGIRYLAPDHIATPTAPVEDTVTPYLHGVYHHDGDLLVVLNMETLLLSSEMRQFESM